MPTDPNFRMTAGVAEQWNKNHAHLMQGCRQICETATQQYPGVDALSDLKHFFENHGHLYDVRLMVEYRPVAQVRSYV